MDAPRFVDGEKFSVRVGRASLRVRPSDDAAQDTELLHGEIFTVYDRSQDWAWGQAASDLYVGYVKEEALTAPFAVEARVIPHCWRRSFPPPISRRRCAICCR